MNIRFNILIIAVLIGNYLFSQVTFQKVIGGPGNSDYLKSVKQTLDGGYVYAGYTNDSGLGNLDVCLLKTDKYGNLQWSKLFGGPNVDYGRSVIQSDDGGFVIAGQTDSYGTGSYDVYLLKTDINGNLLWSKTFGGANSENAFSVIQSADGGFVIAGQTQSYGAGLTDIYLLKADINGNLLWSKTFGGSNHEYSAQVIQNSSNELIIAGSTGSYGQSGSFDTYLIKTDSSGNLLWAKTFGGTGGDFGESVVEGENNTYIIAGYTYSYGTGNKSVYMVKSDDSGNFIWGNTFGSSAGAEEGYDIVKNNNGNYVVTGKIWNAGVATALFMETDPNGNMISYKSIGGTGYDYTFSVIQSTDGGYMFVGATHSWDANPLNNLGDEFYIIKTDSLGSSGCNENDLIPDIGFGGIEGTGGTQGTGGSERSGCVESIWNPDTLTLCFQKPLCTQVNVSPIQKDVFCFSDCQGNITINSNGGSSPFTYSWSPAVAGPTDSIAANLCSGLYSVTVTDSDGCDTTLSFTISEPQELSLVVISTDATCDSADGSASVDVSGGTTGYTYDWIDNGNQTTDSIAGLGSGIYTVIVTDGNGCIDSVDVVVNDFPSASLVLSSDSAQCNGDSSGTATVTSTGTVPFTYSWSSGGTDSTASGLSAGNYTVTVTDGNGCVTIDNITVSEPTAIVLNTTTIDNSSCNQSDGEASVTTSGGTHSYTYQWDAAANDQTTQAADSLQAGSYQVIVTDGNGCNDTAMVVITDIPGPVLSLSSVSDVLCNGDSNGTAAVTATGSSLTYLWAPGGFTTDNETTLSAGTYTVVVTDLNGCEDSLQIVITEPQVLTSNQTFLQASCGNSDGQATATPSGGTAPYSYSWDNDPPQGVNTVDTLSAGQHSVTVTDGNGCDTTSIFTIINTNAPTLTLNQTTQILCYGDSNAVAQATPLGGISPFTYSWDDPGNQSTQSATNLPPGIYTVTVTDSNGCEVQQTITITEPLELTLQISSVDATCDQNNGTITVNTNGGTGTLTYDWNPAAGSGPNPTDLSPDIYTVTITDNNGCITTETATITIATNNPLVAAWPDTTLLQGESVQVNSSGGDTCLWIPSTGLSNPNDCNPIASPDQTTTYIVEIAENGCKSSDTIIIRVEEQNFTIYIPNTFTPNGDSRNELFRIKGIGIDEFHLQIFDRWGERIFESSNINTSWDGLAYGKKEVQEATYIYTLDVINSKMLQKFVGKVTVLK